MTSGAANLQGEFAIWELPGGLNRLPLTDVTTDRGGDAYNGSARFGLVSLREANMELLVHEMGHAWMGWPHSYAEVRWPARPCL